VLHPAEPHGENDLRDMVQHVCYEVGLLHFWTGPGIGIPIGVPNQLTSKRLDNAIVECAGVHLRNVADFLTTSSAKRRKTDLVADDYFDDGWPNRSDFVLGANKDEHQKVKAEIDQRLAHISTHRLTDDFDWRDTRRLYAPLVLQRFTNFRADLRVVHPARAQWFDALLQPPDDEATAESE
jgi:hypothetical protein